MTDPTTRYSLADVARRNGRNGTSTWIVVRDDVYDVTDYKDKHPGGAELMEEYAGRDATGGFDDFGHSSDARKIMREYLIGQLVDEDKRANRKKKRAGRDATRTAEVDKRRRRTFLAVLCGKCTS